MGRPRWFGCLLTALALFVLVGLALDLAPALYYRLAGPTMFAGNTLGRGRGEVPRPVGDNLRRWVRADYPRNLLLISTIEESPAGACACTDRTQTRFVSPDGTCLATIAATERDRLFLAGPDERVHALPLPPQTARAVYEKLYAAEPPLDDVLDLLAAVMSRADVAQARQWLSGPQAAPTQPVGPGEQDGPGG